VRNLTWHPGMSREQRWAALGLRGATAWLTGLPASGKSTIAVELERLLVTSGRPAYRLDGDNLRHGLNSDLGFGASDRRENVRRAAEVALLLADAGVVAIVPLISPYREGREQARRLHATAGIPFVEAWVSTPAEVCEQRDPKGLYAAARSGRIRGFTGVDDPYEPPLEPEVELDTRQASPAELAGRVLLALGLAEASPRPPSP
jgi:bifunctional enzyme CysN/CysC